MAPDRSVPEPSSERHVELIRRLSDFPEHLRGGAVSIGNFDGVHRGHARIVERLRAAAGQVEGPAVAFTFDPHPAAVLRPHQVPPSLTWTERKAELLGKLGVDAVLAYPTDEAFLELDPRQFFDRIAVEALGARAMVEGANFVFGRDRTGNVDMLGKFCRSQAMGFEVVQPLEITGRIVSSSRIRELLASGRLEQASAMLCAPYRIRGRVTRGSARGRDLGFPTANLAEVDTLLPAEGIYAGRAHVEEEAWAAAISLGPNPTFDEGALKVEVFLLDFQGDLYDRTMEVDFLARLRDIRRFDSVDELIEQMDRDVAAVRQIAATANA